MFEYNLHFIKKNNKLIVIIRFLYKFFKYISLAVIVFLFSFSAYSKDILTIYTYSSFISDWGPGPIIKKKFEKLFNCTINFVGVSDGIILLNKLKMEGKSCKADIILGIDNSLIDIAESTGLFAKHEIDISKIRLPVRWNNAFFVPYDYGYLSFVYNKNYINKSPKSFNEILNEKNNWKIIYQDPRTSTTGFGFLLWIEKIYGNKSSDIWKKISKHTITIPVGWTESYALFLRGESDFVLSYTTSPGYHMLFDNTNDYKSVSFDDGHYLQIEVAAILSNSKNLKLSKNFVDFLISEDFQKILPVTNWMYPVLDIELPIVYKNIEIPKISFQFDSKIINKNKNKWISLWKDSIIK